MKLSRTMIVGFLAANGINAYSVGSSSKSGSKKRGDYARVDYGSNGTDIKVTNITSRNTFSVATKTLTDSLPEGTIVKIKDENTSKPYIRITLPDEESHSTKPSGYGKPSSSKAVEKRAPKPKGGSGGGKGGAKVGKKFRAGAAASFGDNGEAEPEDRAHNERMLLEKIIMFCNPTGNLEDVGKNILSKVKTLTDLTKLWENLCGLQTPLFWSNKPELEQIQANSDALDLSLGRVNNGTISRAELALDSTLYGVMAMLGQVDLVPDLDSPEIGDVNFLGNALSCINFDNELEYGATREMVDKGDWYWTNKQLIKLIDQDPDLSEADKVGCKTELDHVDKIMQAAVVGVQRDDDNKKELKVASPFTMYLANTILNNIQIRLVGTKLTGQINKGDLIKQHNDAEAIHRVAKIAASSILGGVSVLITAAVIITKCCKHRRPNQDMEMGSRR